MKTIILVLIFSSLHLMAQTVYELPFESKGNQIELSVANPSSVVLENITVDVESAPEWINFDKGQVQFTEVAKESEVQALFQFSVDKRAPVGEDALLSFIVNNGAGDTWSKEINIKVLSPERYELFQNYPNPFNPATKIEFVIPKTEKVTLKVYDMLGREVRTLINDVLDAGHHEVEFSGSQIASGMYIYNLSSPNYRQIKKMVLVK